MADDKPSRPKPAKPAPKAAPASGAAKPAPAPRSAKPAPPSASQRPAAVPERRPAPKQQSMAAQARNSGDAQGDEDEEDFEEGGGTFLMFSAVPSWLISMVVHIIILLMMALITLDVVSVPEPPSFDIGQDVEENDIEEFQEQKIDIPNPTTEEQTTVEPQPETENIEDIPIETPANDLDAAPQAIELDPLGDSTAPQNDFNREYGAYTGTGLEGRGAAARSALVREGGGTPGSEAAVAAALQWLANHQNEDGSWSWNHQRGECQNRCADPGSMDGNNGATGLALLPFLGAGHTHLEGEYKPTVKKGLDYLLRNMRVAGNRGDLADAGTMYAHGICSISLCEAYAMTQDKGLARPAQMAINQIVFAQDPVGGGWRYQPKEAGDTSVVGWQLMALKSAHLAYLEVPGACVAGASKFLDTVQEDSGSRYGYTSPGTGTATTAVGLLCRMYLGWKHDHPALERGAQFLAATGPSPNNMYYNYYATQVMHHFGGDMWEQWNEVLRDQLVNTQSQEGHQTGSWYVAGDHGSPPGGRLYITCMSTMILEVYYRHMPLYGSQASEEDFPL